MKEQQALQDRYADLLPKERDPQLLQLVQDLDSICSTPQPPARLNWAEVRVMHSQQTAEKRAKILSFRTHVHQRQPLLRKAVLVPAVIGLILVTAAFTFAISPLLGAALGFEPSAKNLLQDNLFVKIHQSQTIGGGTITLEEGYADANQVILVYTVSGLGLGPGMKLSTKGGVDLPSIIGEGATDMHTNAVSVAFRSNAITDNPQALDLQLKIPVGSLTNTSSRAEIGNLGTLTFNFTLPFHPGRIAMPGQQVTSHGRTATLQRVVVTRSATMVVVQGLSKSIREHGAPNVLNATLQAPGESSTSSHIAFPGADGTWSFIDTHDFSKAQGTWTLTVQVGNDTWVFHFVVPA